MASGEMSEAEFTAFLEKALGHHAAHSRDGALHFVCMDWRHSRELLAASSSVYSECKNLCVWVKTNAGMGSLYRSQHELVYVFKVGTAPHVNNVELGRHGRYRSNVWRYAGVNTFGTDRDEALAMHPTVKPVRLVADAILDCSRRGDLVLDGFAGSGTTLLAAERTGRIGYGLELEPRYVDAAIRRMAEHASLEAVLAATGQSFDEVMHERMNEEPRATPPLPCRPRCRARSSHVSRQGIEVRTRGDDRPAGGRRGPSEAPTSEYEVGYGKPPKSTRFQPGQSGNPRGRPKGTKNLKTDLIEELHETIEIREGNRSAKSHEAARLRQSTHQRLDQRERTVRRPLALDHDAGPRYRRQRH
jgi:hypothetical protein